MSAAEPLLGPATVNGDPPAALGLHNVTAGYRGTTVLRGVSLSVPVASVVALLGPNGAGKTTLLRVASGLLKPRGGQVLRAGEDMKGAAPYRRARRGVCLIPEGRGVFRNLTVRDNLRMQVASGGSFEEGQERAVGAFPVLGQRMGQLAGQLSGGQQQMLALARAWVSEPEVVLLDEVSMGLAPRVVDDIFAALRALAAQGTSLLIIEQYVNQVLAIADHVSVLQKGEVVFSGLGSGLDEQTLLSGYLGIEPG